MQTRQGPDRSASEGVAWAPFSQRGIPIGRVESYGGVDAVSALGQLPFWDGKQVKRSAQFWCWRFTRLCRCIPGVPSVFSGHEAGTPVYRLSVAQMVEYGKQEIARETESAKRCQNGRRSILASNAKKSLRVFLSTAFSQKLRLGKGFYVSLAFGTTPNRLRMKFFPPCSSPCSPAPM